MPRRPIDDATRYARAIERRWSRLWEQPVVLSPRDWARIARWYALRIPLEIVEEAMQADIERAGARVQPRRLSALAPLVEEAWAVVLDGRRGHEAVPAPPTPAGSAEAWRRCLDRLGAGTPLAGLLAELLERSAAGESGATLDGELDRRLADAVEPSLLQEMREVVAQALAPFRSRMSGEHFEATSERALVDRLRRRLELPRLARGVDGA